MKTNNAGEHLAILIDGDNVSAKIVTGLMAEVTNYGVASVRRIYGDWTSPQMKSWRVCLLEHSIVPIQQFAYTTGKNATDGAMIIDAMDLLYTNRFSAFCIVSSDSDFTRLAARIREQGIAVYGFGNRHNTHKAFVAACNEFVYFDALPQPAPIEEPRKLVPISALSPTKHTPSISRTVSESQSVPAQRSVQPSSGVLIEPQSLPVRPRSPERTVPQPAPKPLDRAAMSGLKKAITSSSMTYGDDWVNLAEVGHILVRISPDLNARNYGFTRLREFVLASGIVDLKMKSRGSAPPIALVRLKPGCSTLADESMLTVGSESDDDEDDEDDEDEDDDDSEDEIVVG